MNTFKNTLIAITLLVGLTGSAALQGACKRRKKTEHILPMQRQDINPTTQKAVNAVAVALASTAIASVIPPTAKALGGSLDAAPAIFLGNILGGMLLRQTKTAIATSLTASIVFTIIAGQYGADPSTLTIAAVSSIAGFLGEHVARKIKND